jgi:hypothetical protein
VIASLRRDKGPRYGVLLEREKDPLMARCVKCKNVKFFKMTGHNNEVSIATVIIWFRDGRSRRELIHYRAW